MSRGVAFALLALALSAAGTRVAGAGEYRLYATNEGSGDISIVDPAARKEISRVRLGKRPRGIVSSPDGHYLYIALSGSPLAGPGVEPSTLPPPEKSADGVAVFRVADGKVVRVLRGVSDPEQLAITADGKHLYVASEDTGKLLRIDTADGRKSAEFNVGAEPEGVAISPDMRVVLATSEEANTVAVIDSRRDSILARIRVGERPRNAAFLSNTRAVVPGESDASLTLVDVSSKSMVKTIKLSGPSTRPMGVRVLEGKGIFVTTGRGGQLLKMDPVTLKVMGIAQIGGRPWGIAASSDGNFLFTADGPANDLAIVDAKTMRVEGRIAVGDRPWGIVAAPQ